MEFGFPHGPADQLARPENRALLGWWQTEATSFALHASLHGMSRAAGPWFLIERGWAERATGLMEICRAEVQSMGYTCHDIDRKGEKGFYRLAEGFTSRPDSRAMRDHFLALDDPDTAALFRPSSMETVRNFGGDPLSLVSEMPLFLEPDLDPMPIEHQQRLQWRFITAGLELVAGLPSV